ncbi:MAG: EpsG family protein [Prevotella sp.]|jgi:putative capsular polysaccharide biosynthesis protein|nr:EpsG family protein [Prevotella sp.]
MLLYIIVFIVITYANYIATEYNYRQDLILAFSFLILSIFVGFSDMLGGYDRYIYGELFDGVADIMNFHGNYNDALIFNVYPKEMGYVGCNILISKITSNRYIFILLITFVIYLLHYFSLKKYCINYPYALLLFMGLMFFFTFTYLRQMIGVGIGWLALQYIYKRKLYKFLICVLLATSFHNSAIILLPLYFIPVKKFKVKNIVFFMAICLFIGLSGGPSAIFQIYGDVVDMHARTDNYMERDIGFKFEYIMEALIFLYLILKNYALIPNTKKDIVLLNTALGFCAILLLFVLSLNGGRLGWFYLMGLIATLSTICNGVRKNKFAKNLVMVISVILFIRIVFQWSFMLSPYKTFFTNGVRDYDPVYELYEYDENYAIDKFYR